MKATPLKNKSCTKDVGIIVDVFLKEDIKSAVEWLKEQIRGHRKLKEDKCGKLVDLHTYCLNSINEAFEDVVGKR